MNMDMSVDGIDYLSTTGVEVQPKVSSAALQCRAEDYFVDGVESPIEENPIGERRFAVVETGERAKIIQETARLAATVGCGVVAALALASMIIAADYFRYASQSSA